MKLLIKEVEGLVLPAKAHPKDAGYDIVATTGPTVKGERVLVAGEELWRSIDYVEYGTGLFWAPEENYSIELFPRSSLSKHNLLLANSIPTIDNPYRGEVMLRFKYVIQPCDLVQTQNGFLVKIDYSKIYKQGDRICQMKSRTDEEIEFKIDKTLDQTKRAAGGFGSTGR